MRVISNEERANRAIALAEILVSKGQIRRDQVQGQVRELLSVKNSEAFIALEQSLLG